MIQRRHQQNHLLVLLVGVVLGLAQQAHQALSVNQLPFGGLVQIAGKLGKDLHLPVLGQIQTQGACPNCRGTGKIIKKKCSHCHGSGTVRKTKTIEVNIPAGADTGVRMRVSGEGEPGKRGGAYGDLYVYIIVEGDPDFERDGDDLYKAINISFTTAALGSTIQVETLVKKVELKIPAGTQSGTRFRISGEGMPHLQSSRKGSLYVEVKVTVPKKLNEDQKEALLNYAHVCGEDVKQFKGKGSWLDKIIDKIMN